MFISIHSTSSSLRKRGSALVTSVSIDTRHLCLLDAAVRHLNRVVHRLNLVLDLCNVFLFDVNLQGLLQKFLLLFHGNYFTLCCVFLDTPRSFARFVPFLAQHKLDYLLGVLC